MKKILIFSLAYFPKVSGAELAVKEITDRVSSKDIEFHMVTMRFSTADAQDEQIGNVHVHRVGGGSSYLSKILFIPRAALRAHELDRVEKFDALWALMSYMTFPITLLRMLGVRKLYILTLQDGDPFEHVFARSHIKPFAFLLKKGFMDATVAQVISTYLGGWMQKLGYHGPIEVVPNGVDVSLFAKVPVPEEVERLQNRLGKKSGEVWLVHTGRLVTKNGIDTVIRSLGEKYPEPQRSKIFIMPENVHLLLIGSGVEEQNLKDLASELGVSERVHFVGNVDNHKLPLYLRACDIFVRPSLTEGFGTSFIEAMAAELPVIATQEGGIADFLFDEKRNPDKPTTGWAVDKNNPKQIAEAVQDILSNPKKVKVVVAQAKRMVEEKYDWNLVTEKMKEKVFARVLQ